MWVYIFLAPVPSGEVCRYCVEYNERLNGELNGLRDVLLVC